MDAVRDAAPEALPDTVAVRDALPDRVALRVAEYDTDRVGVVVRDGVGVREAALRDRDPVTLPDGVLEAVMDLLPVLVLDRVGLVYKDGDPVELDVRYGVLDPLPLPPGPTRGVAVGVAVGVGVGVDVQDDDTLAEGRMAARTGTDARASSSRNNPAVPSRARLCMETGGTPPGVGHHNSSNFSNGKTEFTAAYSTPAAAYLGYFLHAARKETHPKPSVSA